MKKYLTNSSKERIWKIAVYTLVAVGAIVFILLLFRGGLDLNLWQWIYAGFLLIIGIGIVLLIRLEKKNYQCPIQLQAVWAILFIIFLWWIYPTSKDTKMFVKKEDKAQMLSDAEKGEILPDPYLDSLKREMKKKDPHQDPSVIAAKNRADSLRIVAEERRKTAIKDSFQLVHNREVEQVKAQYECAIDSLKAEINNSDSQIERIKNQKKSSKEDPCKTKTIRFTQNSSARSSGGQKKEKYTPPSSRQPARRRTNLPPGYESTGSSYSNLSYKRRTTNLPPGWGEKKCNSRVKCISVCTHYY